MNFDPGVLTAIATGVVSVITTVLGIRGAVRKQAKENEATIQRVALEQSQAAFASVREEIDRLRADNDRLRADNDRLTRMVDEVGRDNARMAERLQHIEAELEQERTGRLSAEAERNELRERLGL
jgi:predicted RNase H-like nuclease (RuvC/YqgF family)